VDKELIVSLPGDGIGPEVMREGVRTLKLIEKKSSHNFELKEALIGGAAIDKFGEPLPAETLSLCKMASATLLGAVGGYKWDNLPSSKRPERALLGLRGELGVFANLRPIKLYKSLVSVSPLKKSVVGEGLDILVVRELTGGLYFGHPRGKCNLPDGTVKAINTLSYTEMEIERIFRVAFELAQKRSRKLTSVDKANILETSRLWREVGEKISKDYPEVKLNHLYVGNCAMQLIKDPHQFDVIVTGNLFGDILSDEAAMLTGSIGMLASASLGKEKKALYEPVHGSAPDIAGKNEANPLAMIMSVALMLKYSFNLYKEAKIVEKAIKEVLDKGYRTQDIKVKGRKPVGTRKMGNLVRKQINLIYDKL